MTILKNLVLLVAGFIVAVFLLKVGFALLGVTFALVGVAIKLAVVAAVCYLIYSIFRAVLRES